MANCGRLQTLPPPGRRRQQQQQQQVLRGEATAVGVYRCWFWIAAACVASAAAASPPHDLVPNGGEACPVGCTCSADRSHVACNGVGMKTIPKLPYVTEHLGLSGSSVPIANGTFASGCCAGLTSLDLSRIGVRHLPEGGLLGLSNLHTLRLADCQLTDAASLPADAFRPVRQLRSLDLSANPQLFAPTGSSATTVTALRLLTELRSLNLSATGLSSISASLAPSLVFLERLEVLSLSDNALLAIGITREIAQQLNRNDVLQVLELANCGLHRIDPEAMAILKTVTNLDLSGNRISAPDLKRALDGTPSDAALQRLSLARLGLWSIEITSEGGSPVSILAGLRHVKLSVLDLSGNQLSSLGRRQFAMLQQLKRLDLSDNRIEILDSLSFDGLATLTHLVLSRNRIASLSDFDFENLGHLQQLDLSRNRLTNLSRGVFTDAFAIQSLDLSDNLLSSVGEISALELITDLRLAGNQLTSPGALPSYPNLRQIDLSRNRIQSLTSASAWVATSSLTLLNLSGNAIADVDPAVFARHSPQVLDLSTNRLERIRDLGCRPSTQRLLLRGNRARAVEPGAFRFLPDLTELDLGDNALVEFEPTVLAPLARLSSLRLDGNRLGSFLRARAGQSLFVVPSPATPPATAVRAASNGEGGVGRAGTSSPLEELDLSRNGIDTLHDGFFRNLTRLRQLSLAGNRLSRFGDGLAVGLETLGVLDLSANEFTHAPTSALRTMTALSELDLSHNPFDCTGCEGSSISSSAGSKESQLHRATPSGSASSARQTPSTPTLLRFFDDQAYVCRAPAERRGANVHDLAVAVPFLLDSCAPATSPLDAASSIDNSEEKKIILIVIGCTAFVILVVAGIIFWHHRWRLKKKQQKQHCKAAYKQAADRAGAGGTAGALLPPLHHTQQQQQPLLPQHQSQQPLPCDSFLPPVPSTLPPGSVGRPHAHAGLEYGGSCGTYHHRGGGVGGGMPAYV